MARTVNTAGSGSESAEQKALFRWWAMVQRQWPGVLMFAIPNGGARSATTGARLKREGCLAGVPDILLAKPEQGMGGLWIELKRRAGGRASKAQTAVMACLQASGYACAVCHGWREAAETVTAYLEGRWEPCRG